MLAVASSVLFTSLLSDELHRTFSFPLNAIIDIEINLLIVMLLYFVHATGRTAQ